MRFWVGPILVFIIGLIIFTYIHDGPPYFELVDLLDNQWHHEKIIGLLVSAGLFIFALGGRR